MTTLEKILQKGELTSNEALALFDRLDTVDQKFMLGRWHGSGLPTNHPLDGLLETYNWYGKEFVDADHVNPLLFADAQGKLFKVNPAFMPTALAMRLPALKSQAAKGLFLLLSPLLRTTKSKARLRLTEYRGKVSATMIYDNLPIHDVFRKVDENTLMGVMDLKGVEQPFFFILRRDVQSLGECT